MVVLILRVRRRRRSFHITKEEPDGRRKPPAKVSDVVVFFFFIYLFFWGGMLEGRGEGSHFGEMVMLILRVRWRRRSFQITKEEPNGRSINHQPK